MFAPPYTRLPLLPPKPRTLSLRVTYHILLTGRLNVIIPTSTDQYPYLVGMVVPSVLFGGAGACWTSDVYSTSLPLGSLQGTPVVTLDKLPLRHQNSELTQPSMFCRLLLSAQWICVHAGEGRGRGELLIRPCVVKQNWYIVSGTSAVSFFFICFVFLTRTSFPLLTDSFCMRIFLVSGL